MSERTPLSDYEMRLRLRRSLAWLTEREAEAEQELATIRMERNRLQCELERYDWSRRR